MPRQCLGFMYLGSSSHDFIACSALRKCAGYADKGPAHWTFYCHTQHMSLLELLGPAFGIHHPGVGPTSEPSVQPQKPWSESGWAQFKPQVCCRVKAVQGFRIFDCSYLGAGGGWGGGGMCQSRLSLLAEGASVISNLEKGISGDERAKCTFMRPGVVKN